MPIRYWSKNINIYILTYIYLLTKKELTLSTNSEAVKKWRKDTKERMILAMGACCVICGYSKCYEALEFHHIDPTKKDIKVSSFRANPVSWTNICNELQKCVLLCANCHREVHYNLVNLPNTLPSFNTEYLDYKTKGKRDICPICGNEKPVYQITCSLQCAGKKARKVDWDSIDLFSLLKTTSKNKIAIMLGVSEMAVRKRIIKLAGTGGYDPP